MINLKKINPKKAISLLGMILMLASFAFITRRVLQFDIEFAFSFAEMPGLVLNSMFIGSNIVISAFFFWWLLQNLSGLRLEKHFSVMVYCIANLYKYLPGSVMYALGRNRLALEVDELGHAKVFGATLIEAIFAALAALIFAGLLAFGHFSYVVMQADSLIWAIAGTVVFVGTIAAFFFRKKLASAIRTFVKGAGGFNIRIAFWMAIRSFLIMLIMGASFVFTLMLVGQPVTLQQFAPLMGMYILSWLLGFMIPGVPGGLGVREAAVLMIMSGAAPEYLLITAVIIHRMLSIGGDVFAYVFALLYKKWGHTNANY